MAGDLVGLVVSMVTRALSVPLLAAPPNPGTGVAPPGAAKFLTVLQWGAWLVTAACVAGIFIVAGSMAVRHRRGDGGAEAAGGLVWVLVACVLVSSAGPIVNALTG